MLARAMIKNAIFERVLVGINSYKSLIDLDNIDLKREPCFSLPWNCLLKYC